jgi:hypothetical protein
VPVVDLGFINKACLRHLAGSFLVAAERSYGSVVAADGGSQ